MLSRVYFAYIVECEDGSYYTGATGDLAGRMVRHAEGRGARYTRSRRPVRLVYWERLPDRGSALRREREIKEMRRRVKEELVRSFSSRPVPLSHPDRESP